MLHTLSRSTNEVHELMAQLRTPPGALPFFEARIIHFFSSCVPSFSDPWLSAASSGAEISCMATRNSEASEYGMEKASEVSCDSVEK